MRHSHDDAIDVTETLMVIGVGREQKNPSGGDSRSILAEQDSIWDRDIF